MRVEILGEPAAQGSKLTVRNIGCDLRPGLESRCEKLRTQDVAQRVALEDAAHLAGEPMHVLQNAVAVIAWRDAQVSFETLMPSFGQVTHGQASLQQVELKVKAEHHVQAV